MVRTVRVVRDDWLPSSVTLEVEPLCRRHWLQETYSSQRLRVGDHMFPAFAYSAAVRQVDDPQVAEYFFQQLSNAENARSRRHHGGGCGGCNVGRAAV